MAVLIGFGLIIWGGSLVLDSKYAPMNALWGLLIMSLGAGILGCIGG